MNLLIVCTDCSANWVLSPCGSASLTRPLVFLISGFTREGVEENGDESTEYRILFCSLLQIGRAAAFGDGTNMQRAWMRRCCW